MKKTVAALCFMLASALPALAQSSPGLTTGQIPTAAQWNSYFAAKQDVLGFSPVNSAGGTMTGLLITTASTTASSGLRVNPGVAPTSPVNGDIWTTTAGIFVRINGATVGPLVSSTSAAGSIAIGGTSVTSSTSGYVLFANAGSLGQYVISGTGNVAMTTNPVFTTPTLGVAIGTSLVLNGCTLGGNAFCATGSANISGATVIGGVMTYAGVTLANAVTGSGSMVLSAAPTLTGHPTIEGVTATGATGTGRFVFDTAPSMSAVTVTGSFTATGLVTVADLANPFTTVNGVSCTLGSTCSITATAASMTVGTTSVISGTTNQLLYDNGGAVGEVTKGNNCVYGTNGTGVPSCGTTLPSLVVASSLTSVGTLTGGATGAGFTVALTTSTITGTLPCAQMPAQTGDVTSSAGSCAQTLAAGSAANLNSGTLPSARLTGAYTGITGLGTITALTVTGSLTATGLVTNADLAINVAWTSYTPTVSCGGGSLGTNTPTGAWQQVGKIVAVRISIAVTTVSSCTTNLIVSLPTTPNGNGAIPGREVLSTGKTTMMSIAGGSTNGTLVNYDNTLPVANGTRVDLSGVYETQ